MADEAGELMVLFGGIALACMTVVMISECICGTKRVNTRDK